MQPDDDAKEILVSNQFLADTFGIFQISDIRVSKGLLFGGLKGKNSCCMKCKANINTCFDMCWHYLCHYIHTSF